MCWLSLVVRSPPARRSLSWIQSLLIELWFLVSEVSTLNLILLTTQTMVTTGIIPLQGKIHMLEPEIEPGTSWLVVRSSDHQNTRLVTFTFDHRTSSISCVLWCVVYRRVVQDIYFAVCAAKIQAKAAFKLVKTWTLHLKENEFINPDIFRRIAMFFVSFVLWAREKYSAALRRKV